MTKTIEEKYSSHFSVSNLASIKNKMYVGFYEEIADYIEQNNINATQTFLILYPYTRSSNREMIAVIQTEEDTIILDMYDTCHLTTSTNAPTIAYSVEEYRALRMEAEKTLYQNATDLTKPDNNKDSNTIGVSLLIICICGGIAVLGAIGAFILRKE